MMVEVEVAIRSAAILTVAWVVTRLMGRATAATRHLVWHAALVAVVLAPLAAPLIPAIPLAWLARVAEVTQVAQVTQVQRVQVAQVQQVQVTQVEQVPRVEQVPQVPPVRQVGIGEAVGFVALAGSLACVVWFGLGWIMAARVARRAGRAPLPWQLEVNTLRARMHIAREVRLGLIAGRISPLATGLWRATILLPEVAVSWTAGRRQAVLLHELAHIRRRDCRVQLVTQAACALYWFNPLVWIAAAHLRTERERACDDEVLGLGAQPSSYAAHLLDIARDLRPSLRPSAALTMARPSELEGRLLAVLAAGRARVPARASRWTVAATFTCMTVIALGATPAPAAPDEGSGGSVGSGGSAGGYVLRNDVMTEENRLATMHERTAAEQALERSADPQVRERAVLALAFSSGRDVIPALLDALRDVDAQVREKAAIGLALRRDDRVVEALIAAMHDPDSQVREKVAIALGTSADPRARDVLTRALEDPDSPVREKATAALVLLGLTSR